MQRTVIIVFVYFTVQTFIMGGSGMATCGSRLLAKIIHSFDLLVSSVLLAALITVQAQQLDCHEVWDVRG